MSHFRTSFVIRFLPSYFIMSSLRKHSGRQRQRYGLLGQFQIPLYTLMMDLLDKSHGYHNGSTSRCSMYSKCVCVRHLLTFLKILFQQPIKTNDVQQFGIPPEIQFTVPMPYVLKNTQYFFRYLFQMQTWGIAWSYKRLKKYTLNILFGELLFFSSNSK